MNQTTRTAALAILATLAVNCSDSGKQVDPGTENFEKTAPRFSEPVKLSDLPVLGKSQISQLQAGQSVDLSSPIYQICPSCCLSCDFGDSGAAPKENKITEFVDTNACIDDVEAQFAQLNPHGNKIGAYASIDYIHPARYTETMDNGFGLQNHIQGIKRLRAPGYFAISGGDPPIEAFESLMKDETPGWFGSVTRWVFEDILRTKNRSAADLWIVKINSKEENGTGFYGTNMNFGPWNYPNPWDTVVVPLEIEKGEFWHPGGVAGLGDILAVPLQAYLTTGNKKTVFLYLSDPSNPVKIDYEMPGGGHTSMMKLPSGHYLIQVSGTWFLSNSTNFADGFDTTTSFGGAPGGSQAHLIQQCDGEVYSFTSGNTGEAAPTFKNGDDIGKLYKLDFTGTGLMDASPTLQAAPAKHLVGQKTFVCYENGKFCNFSAAAGVYVDPASKKLGIYGVHHFRTGANSSIPEMIRMREFTQ